MRLRGNAICPPAVEASFKQSDVARAAFLQLDRWGLTMSFVLNIVAVCVIKLAKRPDASSPLCGVLFLTTSAMVLALLYASFKCPQKLQNHRTKFIVTLRLLRVVQAVVVSGVAGFSCGLMAAEVPRSGSTHGAAPHRAAPGAAGSACCGA
jgi:hypothetical protein